MNEGLRECIRCCRAFPYSDLERVFNPDWDKFIYFCRSCYKEVGLEEGQNPFGKSEETSFFANKYKNVKGKKEWWDK